MMTDSRSRVRADVLRQPDTTSLTLDQHRQFQNLRNIIDSTPAGVIYLATNRSVITEDNGSSRVLRARLAEILPGALPITYPDLFGPRRLYSPQGMAESLRSVDAVVVWPRRVRTPQQARAIGRTPLAISRSVREHIRIARTVGRPVLVVTPSACVPGESCRVGREPMTAPADLVPPGDRKMWELWMPERGRTEDSLAVARLARQLATPAVPFSEAMTCSAVA